MAGEPDEEELEFTIEGEYAPLLFDARPEDRLLGVFDSGIELAVSPVFGRDCIDVFVLLVLRR